MSFARRADARHDAPDPNRRHAEKTAMNPTPTPKTEPGPQPRPYPPPQGAVAVIGTGGTIAGLAPDATRTFAYEDSRSRIDEIFRRLPIERDLQPLLYEQPFQVGSEDFTDAHWTALAHRIQQLALRHDVAGVVLTQGTDTIEETAYFLHLVLKTRKPVVVTGAMRPASALGSDVALNLYQAVTLARHPGAHGQGVLVVMNDRIHCAREVVKTHTWSLDSLQSPEFGPLGCMVGDQPMLSRKTTRRHTTDTKFLLGDQPLPRVDLVWGCAGISPDVVEGLVQQGALGLVYAGPGNGSVAAAVKPALAAAARAGVAVVRASRVPTGVVVRNAAEDDDAMGLVAAGSLPAVKARVLLRLALAQGADAAQLQRLFDTC